MCNPRALANARLVKEVEAPVSTMARTLFPLIATLIT